MAHPICALCNRPTPHDQLDTVDAPDALYAVNVCLECLGGDPASLPTLPHEYAADPALDALLASVELELRAVS